MKKKISLLGLVLILVFSLAGCGSSNEETVYDQESMTYYSTIITDNFSTMTDTDFQYFRDLSDLELEMTLLQFGLPVAGEDFIGMMDAWNAGIVDCGMITEIGTYEMEVSNTGATLIADFTAEGRNGNIQFGFDEEMNMESLTINPEFSMGEILSKAGMNTLLGMGTVFVVLIFIAFVISLFKYIPVIQGMFSKKSKAETSVPAPAVQTTPVVETVETDDTELIAVIAAAIAAAEGTSTDGFVVRSIKRRKTNNWK